MPARADVLVAQSGGVAQFQGGGIEYLIETVAGVLYCIYVDTATDLAFKKSTDGGLSWSAPTLIFTGTVTQFSVWYDRWSNISAGLIHIAYAESVNDDVFYVTIDTESSDTLSTPTTIFAGTSTAAPATMSICRARGGNVYCGFYIDVGAEGGFYRLPNANVPNGAWDAARAALGEGDTTSIGDHWVLLPGWAADNQDMMALYWDRSASEISRKLYDDSANSWGESSIAGSMTAQNAAISFPNIAATVDIANSRNIFVAWSTVDAANADLRCWTVTESAITETATNVVLNSTDDQGICGITLDTQSGNWWVFYGGKSDGSETFGTSINLYCKVSSDSGATWGPETRLTTAAGDIAWAVVQPRRYVVHPSLVVYHKDLSLDELFINVPLEQPSAGFQMFGG